MAVSVTCDICQTREALGKIRVSVEVENATPAGKVTGRMQEYDSCEGCRGRAVDQAYDEAVETLFEHIPVQAELHTLKEQIHELRKKRETHANLVEPLRAVGEAAEKERDLAVKDAKLPPADLDRLAARVDLAKERVDHHTVQIEMVDSQLAALLARRAELHEATK